MASKFRKRVNIIAGIALALSVGVIAATMLLGFARYDYDGASNLDGQGQGDEQQQESMASADDLPKRYDEDGFLAYIQGAFTTRSINSGDDAIAAVGDVAGLVGCSDAANEFSVVSEEAYGGIAHYRLQQQQDGVEVYGRQVIVSANERGGVPTESDGVATALNSAYAIYEPVDTTPKLTQEEAVEKAQQHADGASAQSADLTIYTLNASGAGSLDEPRLAWKVEFVDSRYFIDAQTGAVIAQSSLVYNDEAATGSGNDLSGANRTFSTTKKDDGSFVMIDSSRNLYCYDLSVIDLSNYWYYPTLFDSNGSPAVYRPMLITTTENGEETLEDGAWVFYDTGEVATNGIDGGYYWSFSNSDGTRHLDHLVFGYLLGDKGSKSPLAVLADDDNNWDNSKAVSLFSNIEVSYDYYLDTFSRKGYDGRNTYMNLIINYKTDKDDSNATSSRNLITAYINNDIMQDTVTHEFTHSVSYSIVHWSAYQGETGALNEGYSDVMAICQGKISDWKVSVGRNAESPFWSGNPSEYEGWYWGDTSKTAEEDDYGYVHNNSTVVSHAAYLMYNKGLNFDELEQIWYSSLYYLPNNATFQNLADALSSAAIDLGYSGDKLNAVTSALSEVGLTVAQKVEKNSDDEAQNTAIDVVLVLDTSGSMAGDPVEAIKSAASKFVQTAFATEGVRVGVVQFNSEGKIESAFSRDATALESVVATFSGGGGTNTADGLTKAQNLLAESTAPKAIVVLMTDGQPNSGCEGEDVAQRLKDRGVLLMTLGYFSASDSSSSSAQQYLERMASTGYHYEATNTASLEAFFAAMAEQITGTKSMYLQVTGDVGVSVTKDGETLASDASGESSYASFGSLTYVRSEDAAALGSGSGGSGSSGTSDSSASGSSGSGSSNASGSSGSSGASSSSSTSSSSGSSTSGDSDAENAILSEIFGGNSTSSGSTSSNSSSGSGTSSAASELASMTKVLRLQEGASYDVLITGNSSGTMSYEIGYVDDNGDYTDFRAFEDISMSSGSIANAVAQAGQDSYLRVDLDGDGVVDETYHAGANSVGAKVDNSALVNMSLIVSGALVMMLASIVVLVETNRKRRVA